MKLHRKLNSGETAQLRELLTEADAAVAGRDAANRRANDLSGKLAELSARIAELDRTATGEDAALISELETARDQHSRLSQTLAKANAALDATGEDVRNVAVRLRDVVLEIGDGMPEAIIADITEEIRHLYKDAERAELFAKKTDKAHAVSNWFSHRRKIRALSANTGASEAFKLFGEFRAVACQILEGKDFISDVMPAEVAA